MTAAQHPTWLIVKTLGAPSARELAEITSLTAAATEADGNPPLSEQTLVLLGSAERAALTLRIIAAYADQDDPDDAQLVGVAVVSVAPAGTGGVVELVVAPDCRNQGVGRALAGAVEQEGLSGLHAWSHGNHAAAAELADRLGMTPVRELWRMRQSRAARVESVPDLSLPDGVRLDTFIPGRDEDPWLEANRAAFSGHPEQGAITRSDLRARMAEPWFDPNGFFLARRGSDPTVLGFHWTKIHPAVGSHPPLGEVYVVGVVPQAQGMGLGKALTIAGIEYLHGQGLQAIMLYVDADNLAAVALYRALGFTRWDVDVMYAHQDDPPSL